MSLYQVSHLPYPHMGLRLAITEMVDSGVLSSVRATSGRMDRLTCMRRPEWWLRRVIEGLIVKRVCIIAALAAQGR